MTRPWKRGTEAQRAANAVVPPANDLGVADGNLVVADGTSAWSALKRLVRVDEVTTAVQSYVSSLVVTNTSLSALATESGYYWALTDSAGHIAVGVKVDGTFTGPKLVVPDASVALSKLTSDVQTGVQLGLPIESGYTWAVLDSAGRIAASVSTDGTFTGPKMVVPDASVKLTKLSSDIQAGIQTSLPAESGYVWALLDAAGKVALGVTADGSLYVPKLVLPSGPIGSQTQQAAQLPSIPVESGWDLAITDTAGSIAGGWRADGSFEAKIRKPLDYGRTLLDTTNYLITGTFSTATGKHILKSVRKSDALTVILGSTAYNAIDPRLSADGTKVIFRTDTPFAAPLLDRPVQNNNSKPAVLSTWRTVALPLDGSSSALTQVTPAAFFVGLGDSLTAGTGGSGGGYLPFLEALTGLPGYNGGMGGQTSPTIAGRFNSPPALITVTGNSIPASGPVTLTAISPSLIYFAGDLSQHFPGTLAGVHGDLFYAGGVTGAASGYTFTADTGALSAAVSCPAGSSFVSDFGETYKGAIAIMWLGRNNIITPQPENDTASCVAHLSPMIKQFIVMSIMTGGGEGSPGTTHANAVAINANLAAAYPGQYLDVRTGMINGGVLWAGGPSLPSALTYLGLTPTTQDLSDIASDTVPAQVRFDQVHLLDIGYSYVAYALSQFMLAKGWV